MVVLITDIAPTGDSKRPKRYFPFAEGPRSCVGQSLAKVSLVATMATLLQHFHFCLADEVNACRGGRYYLAEQSVIQSRGAAARLHHIFYNVKAYSCSHNLCGDGMAVFQQWQQHSITVVNCAARRWVVAKGVRESEQYTLVIGLVNGMSMHAVPRRGVMQAQCNMSSPSPETAAHTSTAA